MTTPTEVAAREWLTNLEAHNTYNLAEERDGEVVFTSHCGCGRWSGEHRAESKAAAVRASHAEWVQHRAEALLPSLLALLGAEETRALLSAADEMPGPFASQTTWWGSREVHYEAYDQPPREWLRARALGGQ